MPVPGEGPADAGATTLTTTGSSLSQRRPRRSSWTLGPPHGATIALAVYVVASLLLFGRGLLPHPGRSVVGFGTDPVVFEWGFEWWPHAIGAGLNPFFTHALYAPDGANVAQATMVPGPAIVMWPVTALFGPLISFDVAELLAPALAGWTTFLLCRRVVAGAPAPGAGAQRERAYRAAFAPALIGGWLMGFSSYMLGELFGHMQLTLVFLIPALAHVLVRTYAGELGRVKATVAIALCLIGLFSVGEEIFATATLFAAITLVVGWLAGDTGMRSRLRATLVPAALGYVVTGVVVSPFLAYSLRSGGEPVSLERSKAISADLLNLVVPTLVTRPFGSTYLATSTHFSGQPVEAGAYLGIPLLVLLLAAAVTRGWRRPEYRVLLIVGVVALVLALGPVLHVRGHETIDLPWAAVARLPVFGLILPSRMILFLWLVAALAVALVLTRAPSPSVRLFSYGLALLSVASLWPATSAGVARVTQPPIPRLFTTSEYKRVIARGQTVLIPPVGASSYSNLWQAFTGLYFNLAGGYVLAPEAPNAYKNWPIYSTLVGGAPIPDADTQARQFLAAHHVTLAVVGDQDVPLSPWPAILTHLGWSHQELGGALVLRPPAGG